MEVKGLRDAILLACSKVQPDDNPVNLGCNYVSVVLPVNSCSLSVFAVLRKSSAPFAESFTDGHWEWLLSSSLSDCSESEMMALLARLRRGTTRGVEGEVGDATMRMDDDGTGVDWVVSSAILFAYIEDFLAFSLRAARLALVASSTSATLPVSVGGSGEGLSLNDLKSGFHEGSSKRLVAFFSSPPACAHAACTEVISRSMLESLNIAKASLLLVTSRGSVGSDEPGRCPRSMRGRPVTAGSRECRISGMESSEDVDTPPRLTFAFRRCPKRWISGESGRRAPSTGSASAGPPRLMRFLGGPSSAYPSTSDNLRMSPPWKRVNDA